MATNVGINITANDQTTAAFRTVSGNVAGLRGQLSATQDTIGAFSADLKNAFLGGGVVVGIMALKSSIGAMTTAIVEAQVQVDKLRNGLNFAVGRSNAAAEIDFIRGSSQKLGLEFASTAQQYTKLAAAAHGTTLEGKAVRDIFTAVAQASTVMGLSAQETEGALLAVSQMISKGKVQAEELRGQLGERLPGAFQVAARAMGVTTAELDKMLMTGTVLSDDFLPKFAAQLSKEVAPEVEAASQSMQASLNRLSSAWASFKQSVSTSGVSAGISNELSGISNYVTVVTEAMDRAKASGSGAAGALSTGLGTALARMPFDTAALAANTLNGTLNFLSAGALNLRTNLTLLPQTFETNAQSAAMLGTRLTEAEKSLKSYQAQAAASPESIYLKSETYQAYLLVQQLRAAKNAQGEIGATNPTTEGIEAGGRARTAWVAHRKAQQDGLAAAMGTYATPNEQLNAELKKQKDTLGDLYSPELDARIRKHFIKPTKEGAATVSEATKGLNLYSDLMDKSSGFEKNWTEQVNLLRAALDGKTISQAQFNDGVNTLLAAQPMVKAALAEQARQEQAVTKIMVKAYEDQAKAHETYIAALNSSAESVSNKVQQLQDEETAAGIAAVQNISLAQAIEQVGLARVRETYAKEASNGADGQVLLALQAEIGYREKLINLAGGKEVREANDQSLKAAVEASQRSADEVRGIITDALMRGWEAGKGFAENARDAAINIFKTLVLRPVIEFIVSPLSMGLSALLGGGAANAATGSAGGMGGAVGALGNSSSMLSGANMLSSMGGWFTDFKMASTNALYEFGGKLTEMGAEKLGSMVTANASSIGNFANAAGYAMNAISALDAASRGEWGKAIGTGLGATFFGPLGGAIGGAIGGWVDSAFGGGHEYTTGTGMQGKFANGGFSGNNYQTWQNDGSSGFFGIGGSGSSSGKNLSSMDSGTQSGLSSGFMSIQIAAAGMSAALGLDAKKIATYSQDISIALGSDAEANKKAIEDMFASVADGLAASLAPNLAEFAKSGETSSATLARLSTSIITANSWLSLLRQRLYQVSLAGGDAASKLADAFGSLDNLAASSKAFYDTYYSDAEKVTASQSAMTSALQAFGFALPTSKDALRDLALSLDLNTDSGRAAYAALLQLAPQFAETSAMADKMATDTAAALIKTFTGNGRLLPALDAAALSLSEVQAGAAVATGALSYIHQVMLDTSSPVLTLGNSVATLGTGLSGAQNSTLALRDQIEHLSGASGKAVIDFAALSTALQTVDTATFSATIAAVFEALATRVSDVINGITTERVAVRDAALGIVGPTAMSKESIAAGIAGVNTKLPTNTALIAANAALSAANSAQALAQSQLTSAGGSPSTAALDASKAQLASANANAAATWNSVQTYLTAYGGSISHATQRALDGSYDYADTTGNGEQNGQWNVRRYREAQAQVAPAQKAVDTAQAAYNALYAQYQAQLATAGAAVSSANAAQQTAAQKAANALLAYQSALQNFTIDAGKSVARLSNLRAETVKYYEAQQALADLMHTSAASLLGTVSNYRFGQLTPEQQAANLQSQFASAYSTALAAQGDGATLAAQGDKLNGLLGPLIDALNATGQGSSIGSYLAQAEKIAALLNSTAPKDYQADSLKMLGDIDATLAALDASTRSAEQIISDAVKAGSDRTASGLYAVIQAITGKSVPAFVGGGSHIGGLRIVGENGPELEATGPSRIFSASQTRSMLAGGGNTVRLEALVERLTEEVSNLRAEARSTAISSGKTAKILSRVTQDGEAIQTVVAA